MYSKFILSQPNFLGERARWNFGKVVAIFSVIPTVFCFPARWYSVLRRPKTNLKSTIGQDCLSHIAILCIERAYVNRLDLEKVIDEFSSKKDRSKFFFQLIFRQKNIGDLNIIKKVNWWILCLSKEILTLPINKKLELNSSFVPIINRCLSSLQMTFKCFFLVNP